MNSFGGRESRAGGVHALGREAEDEDEAVSVVLGIPSAMLACSGFEGGIFGVTDGSRRFLVVLYGFIGRVVRC